VKGERRKQTSVLPSDGQCTLCGAGLMLVTSRKIRNGAAWLNPTWDAEVQKHEVCLRCGARLEVY
jgi:hypothetical protein